MEELNLEPKPKEHTMQFDPSIPGVKCECGWVGKHNRKKILIQKILRHTKKTGHEFKDRQ